MALFRVTSYKRLFDVAQEQPWTNVYHVDATSVEDALDHAESIVEIEKTVHWSNVEFFRVSAKQDIEDGPAGQARNISELGDRDASGEDRLPLFCSVRVTLDDLTNRPDQKYIRGPVMESENNQGSLAGATITLFETSYADALIALTFIRSSSGGSYIGKSVTPFVQMRQRNWKRASRPGFHRGWVPDA